MTGTKGTAPGPGLRRKIFAIGMALLLLIVLVTAVFGKKGLMDIRRARRELSRLETELKRLEAEKGRLEEEIARLEKEPRAVERQAREKLGLAAPGEKVIIIPDKNEK
jgi:cell division protein FtsB